MCLRLGAIKGDLNAMTSVVHIWWTIKLFGRLLIEG